MADVTDALINEIRKLDTITGTHTPANAVEALMLDKLKAYTRVLEMLAGLKDETTIEGRVHNTTVDVKKLKTSAVLSLTVPGLMINLDETFGND